MELITSDYPLKEAEGKRKIKTARLEWGEKKGSREQGNGE
jgi:hypothetical protein